MANAAIDHIISLVIFMAALLIFIGLFSQNIQTGVSYQQHQSISTKTSDLLDTILLNPGIPNNWSQIDATPVGFGLQFPDSKYQYQVSSRSAMRLASNEPQVYYQHSGTYYNNIALGSGGCLLVCEANTLSYHDVLELLGVRGAYGFQLTLTPTVTVEIQKTSTAGGLAVDVDAYGTGAPLADTPLTYNLLVINQAATTPSYRTITDTATTDAAGQKHLEFPTVNGETDAYALIVYVHLDGLKGVGYFVHQPAGFTQTVAALVDSFESRTVTLAHGDALVEPPPAGYSELNYNASFAILTEEYTLRPVLLSDSTGTLIYNSGSGQDYLLTVPDNDGILIITYKGAGAGQYGLTLMPWGLGSLGYPLTFGGDPSGHDWVTTDIRQVTIGGFAYQAKLSLWQEGNL